MPEAKERLKEFWTRGKQINPVKYKNVLKDLNAIFTLDAVEGEERCPRCNGNNTVVTARQFRAADEANTVLGFCRNCNRGFKP